MTAPTPTPTPAPPVDPAPADPATPTPPVAAAPTAPAAPAPPVKRSLEDSLATLDDDTRAFVLAEVAKARKEAGDARGNAKKQAADEARADLAQTIGKALGLVEGDEPADPAKLTEQLTETAAEAKQAKVELAVYRAAAPLGGDPAALLDSRSFMASLADVDPTDANAVGAAIQTALEAAPALKTAPTRRLPGPNPAPGGGLAPGIDDQIAAAKKAGDVKTWMHLENQKLAAPSR